MTYLYELRLIRKIRTKHVLPQSTIIDKERYYYPIDDVLLDWYIESALDAHKMYEQLNEYLKGFKPK